MVRCILLFLPIVVLVPIVVGWSDCMCISTSMCGDESDWSASRSLSVNFHCFHVFIRIHRSLLICEHEIEHYGGGDGEKVRRREEEKLQQFLRPGHHDRQQL